MYVCMYVYVNARQCRDINWYYKGWISCKNCDLGTDKCLCHFDVLQKAVKNSLKMT